MACAPRPRGRARTDGRKGGARAAASGRSTILVLAWSQAGPRAAPARRRGVGLRHQAGRVRGLQNRSATARSARRHRHRARRSPNQPGPRARQLPAGRAEVPRPVLGSDPSPGRPRSSAHPTGRRQVPRSRSRPPSTAMAWPAAQAPPTERARPAELTLTTAGTLSSTPGGLSRQCRSPAPAGVRKLALARRGCGRPRYAQPARRRRAIAAAARSRAGLQTRDQPRRGGNATRSGCRAHARWSVPGRVLGAAP